MIFKESQTVELKASTSELKDALKDLCAFANTETGTLYFGIRDDGTVVGQDISDRTIQRVTTEILTQIEPRLYPTIETVQFKEKSILKVELKNTSEKPYFLKGKAYKRVGTSNAYLSRYEIEKMMYERDNPAYHYDKSPVPEYHLGINEKRLSWLLEKAEKERNLPTDDFTSQKVILEKLGVVTGGSLNIAGILAFGKEIIPTLPTAYIKCALFEGTDKGGRIMDYLDITEDVFRQIDLAENFILRNIRKSAEISEQTGRRESRYEVPYRAIREAIANAVAHRDYRLSSTIDIPIFDDRIEVWSPGSLPQGMTMELLQQDHFSVLRNPVLAELLYLTRYIEHWGTGIRNMKTWMEEYGLPQPEYKESSAHFITILKRRKVTPQVSPKYPPSTPQVELIKKVLMFCGRPRSRNEIQKYLQMKDRKHFRTVIVDPLINKEMLLPTIPEKPHSPKQQYITTEKGRKWLEEIEKRRK